MSFTAARTRTAALKAAESAEQRKTDQKAAGNKDDKDDAVAEEQEAPVQGAPTGIFCLLLCLASEVLRGRGLFVPAASASKDSPVLVVVDKLKTVGQKLQKRHSDILEKSILERVSLAFAEVLKTQQVFETIHSLVMICLAVAALLNAAVSLGLPAIGQIFAGKRQASSSRAPLLFAVLSVVPVAIFGYGHFANLLKALRSVPQLPALCDALQHALRVAAVVVADADGTPAGFAMFQAASLLTRISSEVASGRLAEAIAPIRAKQDFWSLLDNSTATHGLISLLGTLWLAFGHLRRHSALLAGMALLSIAASPVTLALGWPEASKLLGLPTNEAHPERGRGWVYKGCHGCSMPRRPRTLSSGRFLLRRLLWF
ncbi:unnamed protein product [Symbiodinium necroappetens]|uniref:Uncharacterized protein n=1 Tax=Symbiodinium necroappetens TaxID=1628268 RepID=A0A813BES9_9DINO|nr:unnamed protein product [Symbiodinium necroappetens]